VAFLIKCKNKKNLIPTAFSKAQKTKQ